MGSKMIRRLGETGRLARIGVWLFVAGAAGALPAQTLQITSPADGILVNSGQTLSVTVNADPSVFQYVLVGTCLRNPAPPPQTGPSYLFNIQIPLDASSGLCAVGATGSLASGGGDVWDQITIDVERADGPQQLIPGLAALVFSFAGTNMSQDVTGVFADGSRVMLTHSTYIAYSSDTPSVATVDDQGMVTAVAPGTANITITYGNASLGTTSIQVPVIVPVPMTVIPSTSSLYTLQTKKFTTTLFMDPNLDQSVIWSITPGVGSIDQTGLYTAPSTVPSWTGVTVTATSVADPTKSSSAQIWIFPPRLDRDHTTLGYSIRGPIAGLHSPDSEWRLRRQLIDRSQRDRHVPTLSREHGPKYLYAHRGRGILCPVVDFFAADPDHNGNQRRRQQ
jgi:hypothetical protein